MDTTLKLYKETASGVGVKPMPFPDSGDKQACLSDYKYSATRMSSAPNITATLKWPRCLDDEWSTSVFVSYNGERFFVKNTPSSSYDNTSCLYSHSLELVSERAVLDSVYFLNVPTTTSGEGDNSQGDSLSDSTEFAFSGDIHEFVNRLNKSLIKTGVGGFNGYSAVVDKDVTSDTKLFSISNQYVTDVLKSAYELYNIPYYFVGKVIHFGNQQNIINTPPLEYGANNSLLSISKSNSNKQVVTRITGTGSNRNIPYYYPNPTPKGKIYLESISDATFVVKDVISFCNNMDLDKWVEYTGVDYTVDIDDFSASTDGLTYTGFSSSDLFHAEYKKDIWIKFTFSVVNDFVDTYIDCSFNTTDRGERPLTEMYVDSVLMGKDGAIATSFVNGMVNCGKLTKASYTITLHLRYGYVGSNNYDGYFKIKNLNKGYWRVKETGETFDINKASIYVSDGTPKYGDMIKQSLECRIDVKNKLMPSEYRRSRGASMWYNATNAANRDEWYGDVVFDNVYDSRHPVEYIHTDEEIYPTIKGVTNKEGENIDTFIGIAFDDYDNNEIYPEDYEDEKLAGKYKHPYFFVKLRKTDGPNGFNLFDHAIEGETMKISFTTGHVAGCEFEIGVDEETQKNPVQVDANGYLVRDEDGNVVIRGSYIDSQQDTRTNEVWIALKKEDSTMGVMMPDTASQLVPLGGDKFVILGIHLPEAYITAAEDRLEQELIKYLKENNRERFSFSLKLSSIYLAENEAFAKTLNENSRVTLLYNDTSYTMYVTSYALTVKESSALPEVTISINDELKAVRPKVKDVSLFIDSTDTKIKNVRKTIQNTNESIKTLSEGSNNISNQLNTLIGDDAWMSAREIAERVANPIDERVNTLIGTDINKSARAIATEVLTGASTGGDIDLSLYLSKTEAEATYEKKDTSYTKEEVYTKKEVDDKIIAQLAKKADKTTVDDLSERLGNAETDIVDNSNLLSSHSQQLLTLQAEQKSQNDTIKQQGATILALDVEVDGVKGDVSKANKAIESIETELENKADKSVVDLLSKDLVSTKAVVEIIAPQVNANADAIKSKASQEEVDNISESVTTLEGSVEEISNRVDNKADKGDVQNLVSQINNKVEQTTYNNKVAELEASIKTNKDNIDKGIVYLKGYSEEKANEAEADAKAYTDEEIAKVDAKSDNALDKADKALADISELDASVKSSFDDIGTTFDTLDSVITGINTTATNALTKATEVEAEVDKLAKDVESNTKTIAEHTKTIAEHTEIVTMLNNRCDSIEDTAEELESQISKIETNVTSLDEHIDEVEEKANNASAQASELAGIVTENTNNIDILVGTDNDTSVRAIANNAIDQKTILLEDAATSQDDDGLVTAKDAVTYFASKSYVNRDVNRIDGEIAGIEASMSSLEDDIKNVENTLGALNTTITQVSKKTDNAVSQAESATTKADEAKTTANSVSAQMSGVLTQVQNNTTQIGIIAKDYLRKDQAADFATDLTGVVEATAEEFVYRPSAGDKSIRDKSAVIRRIKGNSVVWEQKLKSPSDENANWQGYSSSMLTTEIQGREMRCTLTGASVATNPYQVGITGILPSGSVGGHKYLFCAWVKVSYLNSSLGNHFSFEHDWNTWTLYPAISEIDKWTFISRIWESPQNNNRTSTIRPPWAYTSANGAKTGDWYAIKDAMLFDLTAMFGAGNEPATVEEFRKVYNEAYYPYCQPELRGVKTGAIKTIGFNLFDGNYARVIGGMSYIVSNYAAVYYSETKNGAQTAVLIKDGVYTPECSGYLYLTPTPDATPCVHFQHSGVMDGECAPYEEHTLDLPEILRLFRDGMHGLRNTYHDVYDEINIDNYIKRLEIVDLGSLWWNSDSSRQCFHAPLNTHKVRGIALCTRYTCSTLGGISDKQLSTHNYYGSDRIFIKDVDFDNPTDFMASLQGVYLVYELNEPIITSLSEPITLDYYCEDWGSEEAISASSASAPFRADIVYQFNAEGRIRDNSRNIDKLEKIVAPLKNIPSNTPLATQDFVYAHIPTRVATATERIAVTIGEDKQNLLPNGDEIQYLLPNMLYDYGATSYDKIELPNLLRGDVAFNNKWMVRFASRSSDAISIPFDVFWKDGIAPSWSVWGVCEMTFFKDAEGLYTFGEWKIYK